MKKINLLLSIMLFSILIVSCGTEQKAKIKSTYSYEVSCLGVGNDGTKLVKVWGYGAKPQKAINNAEKNAIAAAIFRGIPAGGGAAATPALCKSQNCYEQHQDFFDEFFKPGGKYLQFINLTNDGTPSGADRIKINKGYKIAVTASIAHRNLSNYLKEMGIIKGMGSGF